MFVKTVRAELAERFIFNYRLPVDELSRMLPAGWLEPQVVNGYAVASFCTLDLRNIVPAPLPPIAGASSISCAPRYAVMNVAGSDPTPAVFLTRRYTNSCFGSLVTKCSCIAPHPYAPAAMRHDGDFVDLTIGGGSDSAFAARVRRLPSWNGSRLFGSVDEFADFIAMGVVSFGRCNFPGRLTRIDLRKSEGIYEPLGAGWISSPMISEWEKRGAEFDSAFRTAGGCYEWTYRGTVEA